MTSDLWACFSFDSALSAVQIIRHKRMQNIHQHLPQETKETYLKMHFPGQDLKQKNLKSPTLYHKIFPKIPAMET
jgi:hypothetical protein